MLVVSPCRADRTCVSLSSLSILHVGAVEPDRVFKNLPDPTYIMSVSDEDLCKGSALVIGLDVAEVVEEGLVIEQQALF